MSVEIPNGIEISCVDGASNNTVDISTLPIDCLQQLLLGADIILNPLKGTNIEMYLNNGTHTLKAARKTPTADPGVVNPL